MKKTVLLLVLSLAAAGFLGAETLILTVDEAVDLAIARNLQLKQSGITLRTAERGKSTAWNAFLPSLSASAGFSAKHGIIPFENNSQVAITDPGNLGITAGLDISLPLNAAAGTGVKNLVAKYEAGLLDYEAAARKLSRDVRKAFYNVLANQENIRIQQANIDLAQKRFEQAQNNFESGLVPQLDVLSAEVALAGLRPAYNKAEAGYRALLLAFKTTIGAERSDDINLIGELATDFYDLDSEELIKTYAAKRLDIRSLDKQIEALKYSKSTVALNSNSPTLNLGYRYGLSGSNSETGQPGQTPTTREPWSDWADRATLSLTLNWKFDGLIPGSKTDVQVKGIQDSIDSLGLAREIAWTGAGTEITNIVDNLFTARLTIEANTSSTELARRKFELTEEAYAVGTKELLDVESAQNDYLAAQQQLLVAKYEYVAGLLDLEHALNAPMEEFLE